MFYSIQNAEATAYHNAFPTAERLKYSEDVKEKLKSGYSITAIDYLKAHETRVLFSQQLDMILKRFDAFVLSTLPAAVPQIGQAVTNVNGNEMATQNAMIYLTWVANLTGLPAVSVPCGMDINNLPVGLMLMGTWGSDDRLLEIAQDFTENF